MLAEQLLATLLPKVAQIHFSMAKSNKQSPQRGEGKASCWMWPQHYTNKVLQKKQLWTEGQTLITMTTRTQAVDLGQQRQRAPGALPIPQHLESKCSLWIIPQYFNLVYLHSTQRGFYFWLFTSKGISTLTGCLAQPSPCR